MSSDFISHRKEFDAEMDRIIERTLYAIGEFVQGEAGDELERAPRRVRWGRLQGSIDFHVENDKDEPAVFIGTDMNYAVYVHEGTGKYHPNGRKTPWIYYNEYDKKFYRTEGMAPNRFLKNAVVRNRKQIERYFNDNLKRM